MLFYWMRDSQERQGLRSAYRRPYGPRDNGNREKQKVEKNKFLQKTPSANSSEIKHISFFIPWLFQRLLVFTQATCAASHRCSSRYYFWSSSDHKRSQGNKARGEFLTVCFDWSPHKYGYGHLLQTHSGLAAGYSRRSRQTSALLKTN